MKTIDVIKILPFEEEFKKEMLLSFDTFDEDLKFEMERIIWDIYDAIFKLKVEEKLELGLEDFKYGTTAPDPDFYQKIVEQVKKEMSSEAIQTQGKVDLEFTREALHDLMQKNSN